jgi:hypothetical protein
MPAQASEVGQHAGADGHCTQEAAVDVTSPSSSETGRDLPRPPGSQKHRLKGNINSSRCLTDEVCVRLMSSIVDSSCPRRDSTPIGAIRSHAARRPQRKLSSVISGGGIPSPCASHRPAHCHSRRRPVAPYTRLAVDWTDRHRYPAPHRHPVVHSGIGRLPAVVAQESARNSHPHWLGPKLTRVRRRPQRLPAVRLRAS